MQSKYATIFAFLSLMLIVFALLSNEIEQLGIFTSITVGICITLAIYFICTTMLSFAFRLYHKHKNLNEFALNLYLLIGIGFLIIIAFIAYIYAGALIAFVILAFYSLPSIIAMNKKDLKEIMMVNLTTGWMIIGWFAALKMSLEGPSK